VTIPGSDDQVWMSPVDVARYLGVDRSTVFRMLQVGRTSRGRDGLYPTYKLGHKTVRIKRCDVDAYVEKFKVGR
jgi:excisionase family DNA binding protein